MRELRRESRFATESTNGAFVATSHRVRKVKEERYSFPLFFNVDYRTVVQPLPQFADGPARAALVAGEHLFAQTAQTFAYLRSRLDSGELVLPEGSVQVGTFVIAFDTDDDIAAGELIIAAGMAATHPSARVGIICRCAVRE